MSELEAKIITSFNSSLYDALKDELLTPQATELKRSDFNVINLTFIIRNKEELDKTAGKIIITLPESLLDPDDIEPAGDKFSNENFPNSETLAKILVGKTKFSLYDLKHLENEDVVVFEDSNIKQLKLSIDDTEMDVNISPNMELLIPDIENEGDEDMGETHKNIWDSIEVEMYAEFDSVKITLGELKNIEDGLVVDLTSLYDNNVTLKVEGKPIASGSLVIVNDRYGVKINNVIAQEMVLLLSNRKTTLKMKNLLMITSMMKIQKIIMKKKEMTIIILKNLLTKKGMKNSITATLNLKMKTFNEVKNLINKRKIMGSYLANFTVYAMAMTGLIFFAVFIYKKVMNGGFRSNKSNFLNIEETMSINPRKSLLVVRAGEEKIPDCIRCGQNYFNFKTRKSSKFKT